MPDGSADLPFNGTGGVMTSSPNRADERYWGVGLQSDGKILAVGEQRLLNSTTNAQIVVSRYTST